MLDLTINLPGQAISANSLYKRGRGGQVFLAPEAVAYRKLAVRHVKDAMKFSGTYEGGLITAYIHVYGKFFNNDGSIKDVDLDNSLKNLLDSIFPILGVRDSSIFGIELYKIHTRQKPKCQIKLTEVPLPNITGHSLKEVSAHTKLYLSSMLELPRMEWRSASFVQTASVSSLREGPLGKTYNHT